MSAAASIILIGTIRSFLEKKKSNNLNNLNTKYLGKVLQSEKADVNITLTAETAMASFKLVKKAYSTLLMNIDSVIPKELLDRILHQILATDGKHWSCGFPTFDELAKSQKMEVLKMEKEKEKEMEIARQRERGRDREVEKIVSEKTEKISIKNEVTVIPHLLGRERKKEGIDGILEKSNNPALFQHCSAPSSNSDNRMKSPEMDSDMKNILVNQYIIKSERKTTDSPVIKVENPQNRANYNPIILNSLMIKEEKEMNHAKSKIRFDMGETANNPKNSKSKTTSLDLDLLDGVGPGSGAQRDKFKHEESSTMGGMGVLSSRKLQKISS